MKTPDEEHPSFLAYHEANPEIYEMFKHFTFQLIGRGHQHFGPQAVMARVRFETAVSGLGQYKIDDRYVCYYARRFAHDFPQHAEFYRQRPRAFLWQYGPVTRVAA